MNRRNFLAQPSVNMLAETPAGAMTANPFMLAQAQRSRAAFDRPQAQGLPGALDFAAAALAPFPVAGDIAGLASDAYQMYDDPSQRTWANMGLTAAGVIPFVPRMKPNAPDAPAAPDAAATARREATAENVFRDLSDTTLYALRKSAREKAASSNDPAAIFRLQKINEELARRGL